MPGDTKDGIAERFFDRDERKRLTWQEYRCEVMELNKHLKPLMVGDEVTVHVYKKK